MDEKILFVSIIIPCRNEKNFIGQCLESIAKQTYPKENLEVLVIDGISSDGTKEIVKTYIEKYPFIKLLENPKKYTPFGLNIGIREARGEVVARMDAHASYEKEYISKCVYYLQKYGADNVGGQMVTRSRNDTVFGRAVVAALSNRFGVGNAIFRVGAKEPTLVDTVFGGCYRREVFDKIGYFDENLPRGQDMDLNLRLRKFGGKILLVPEIKSFYYAISDVWSFLDHSFTDGTELISPLKFGVNLAYFEPWYGVPQPKWARLWRWLRAGRGPWIYDCLCIPLACLQAGGIDVPGRIYTPQQLFDWLKGERYECEIFSTQDGFRTAAGRLVGD